MRSTLAQKWVLFVLKNWRKKITVRQSLPVASFEKDQGKLLHMQSLSRLWRHRDAALLALPPISMTVKHIKRDIAFVEHNSFSKCQNNFYLFSFILDETSEGYFEQPHSLETWQNIQNLKIKFFTTLLSQPGPKRSIWLLVIKTTDQAKLLARCSCD